jgi:hypothetical protein
MPERRRKPAPPAIAVGDHVLCGGCQASYPNNWYLGYVLWVDGGDALIERSTMQGQTWREVIHLTEVRAVGTVPELVTIERQARDAVAALMPAIRDAEHALGQARTTLFAKLEELAKGGLKVIPLDTAAIDAESHRVRAAVDQEWTESEARRNA